MSRSDSVLESFLVWPLAAAALAGKANVRFLEDLMSSVSGTQEEAQKSAENLKARYPLLQVKVYDAAAHMRTRVQLPTGKATIPIDE